MATEQDSTADKTVASVRYTLSVTITVPVDEDTTAVDYVTASEKRHLERTVIQALKKLDGDTDAEVMETEYLDADGHVVMERAK